jgi:pyruvate, orthophosphate dikinase
MAAGSSSPHTGDSVGIPPRGSGGGGRGERPLTRAEVEAMLNSGVRDLSGRNVMGTDLRGLPLVGVAFREARMDRARVDRPGLISLIEGGSRLREDQLHDLRRLDLRGEDLRHLGAVSRNHYDTHYPFCYLEIYDSADPSRLDLDLSQADLAEALLEEARMDRGQVVNVITRGSRYDGSHHDLAGIDLQGETFKATDDLSRVSLDRANLGGIHMVRPLTEGISVRDANMTGTRIGPRQLQDIVAGGSRWREADGRHDLREVSLEAQALDGLDLRSVDIDLANLAHAGLRGTRIGWRPIVYNILDAVRKYAGRDTLGPAESLLPELRASTMGFAQVLRLRDGVPLYWLVPGGDRNIVHEWRMEARRVLGAGAFHDFRRVIHERPSPDNVQLVRDWLDRAESGVDSYAEHNLPVLRNMLRLGEEIFEGRLNLGNARAGLSIEVRGYVDWPASERMSLSELSRLAISVREAFDNYGDRMDAKDRWGLMQLAVSVDRVAFGLCALEKGEAYTASQARKMSALLRVMYGTGYGHRGVLEVARRLDQLVEDWGTLSPKVREDDLYRYGVHGLHVLEEVRDTYHELFDDVTRDHGEKWGYSKLERRSYTAMQYRAKGVFQMGVHLESLGVRAGNRETVAEVQGLMAKRPLEPNAAFLEPYFFHKTPERDPRVLGGKGLGLVEMTQEGEPVPPGFTLSPLVVGEQGSLSRVMSNGLARLEELTGRRLAPEDLRVSIRSGAAVSMPGMMDSVMDVGHVDSAIVLARDVGDSWHSSRAASYRKSNGVPDDWGTSISVQTMVDATKDTKSGAGIARSESHDGRKLGMVYRYGQQKTGDELVAGYEGEDLVPEGIEPQLRGVIQRAEARFGYPIEVEFVVESGQLRVLQRRRAHLTYEDAIRWASARVQEGELSQGAAVDFLSGRRRLKEARETVALELSGGEEVIASQGIGNGPPYVGQMALSPEGIAVIQREGGRAVFVSPRSDARAGTEEAIQAGAVIFNGGNPLSHLAGVANTMGLSYVGGLRSSVDVFAGSARIENLTLREGGFLSLDPRRGTVYRGQIPLTQRPSEVAPLIDQLLSLSG